MRSDIEVGGEAHCNGILLGKKKGNRHTPPVGTDKNNQLSAGGLNEEKGED